ncbi:hypothetical protein SAMN05878391_2611 [Salinicoccus kekensis]|uniref:Uncharacterized protein n=1 Tax=Salinicoccus kekensis TaxID=714307 RepID=A0A285UUR1_9STAP|nr:hypothetical protein SAMN05878391_2611 [Salinicoccus kekensis]
MCKIKNKFTTISLICLLIGILVWIPNILFEISSPFWLLTFIVSPIGVVFGVLSKRTLLIFLNALMFFSFFIFMAIGYIINSMM